MLKLNFMTTNLVESIQRNLGFAELNKVDPNTQEAKGESMIDKKTLARQLFQQYCWLYINLVIAK